MQIEILGHGLYRIEAEGGPFLGFRIGSKAARSAARVSGILGEAARLSGKGRAEDWPLVGLTVHQDELVVYGPWIPGFRALGAIGELPPASAMEILAGLVETLTTGDAVRPTLPGGLFLNAVAFDGDGRYLILPDGLQKVSLSLLPAEERIAVYDSFHRAGLSAVDDLSFGLDVLAFRIMTGVLPYENPSDLHRLAAEQQAGVMFSPRCLSARVPEIVENYFRISFWQKKPAQANPATCLATYRAWEKAVAEAQGENKPDERALAMFHKRRENFDRRQFVKKFSLQLGLGAVALVMVASIATFAIGNLLRPPKTAGMEAQQVIEAYYGSFNTLDSETIKDTVQGDTGQDLVSLVDNLFVISQIRQGTERRTLRVPLADWLSHGQPALDPGLILFGINGLVIKEVPSPSVGSVSRTFTADYELCTSAPAETGDKQPSYMVATFIARHDELTVSKSGKQGAWIISKLVHHQTGERKVDIPAPTQTGQ